MGESKRKRETLRQMLVGKPGCIYCAGSAAATTIEHMPPISMFEGRDRPNGLEFPACEACNGGTKHSDLVAAMLSRCWTVGNLVVQQDDMKRLLKGVANNVPGLLQEMWIGRGAEKLARKRENIPVDLHPVRADGPILNRHISTFAAKFGFALHSAIFGVPVPQTGGVAVVWYSNFQACKGQIPSVLFELMPEQLTLRQGVKSANNQFEYTYGRTDDGCHMLYFAAFNRSFAVAGVTATDRRVHLEACQDLRFSIFVPGAFRTQIPSP